MVPSLFPYFIRSQINIIYFDTNEGTLNLSVASPKQKHKPNNVSNTLKKPSESNGHTTPFKHSPILQTPI